MDYNCEGVYLKIFTEEELSNERWKPVKNYEDYYEVSNLEENKVINHLDFNPLNNRVDNLEQVTKFENDYYSRGRNSIKLMLNDVEFIRTSNLSNKELSKILGVTTETITMVRQGRMWKTDQIVYGNIVPSLSNRKEYLEKSHREDLIERCND